MFEQVLSQILVVLISSIIGSVFGGTIVKLALTQFIDKEIEKKQDPMWKAIDNIKENFSSKEVCKVKHDALERELCRMNEVLYRIESKIDSKN